MAQNTKTSVNLFRRYIEVICSVNNSELIHTAKTLIAEATDNNIDFTADDNTSEYKENNLRIYLSTSQSRTLPKKVATAILHYFDPVPFREIIEVDCFEKAEEFDSEKLEKLSTELKVLESLIDITNIEEQTYKKHQAELENSEVNPIIQRAVKLFLAMLTTIKQKTKQSSCSKSETASFKLLQADQNRIAGIIEELATALDRMIALSILADFAHPIGADRPFISKISKLIHTPQEQHKDKPIDVDMVFRDDIPEMKHYPNCEALAEQYSTLFAVNSQLQFYIKRYPQYILLQELYQKGMALELWMFYRDPLRSSNNPYFEDVEDYRVLLDKCSRNIVHPSI